MVLLCGSGGCELRAVALGPQLHVAIRPYTWKWVPTCENHLRGWWRGCDIPHDERPFIVPLRLPRNSV